VREHLTPRKIEDYNHRLHMTSEEILEVEAHIKECGICEDQVIREKLQMMAAQRHQAEFRRQRSHS